MDIRLLVLDIDGTIAGQSNAVSSNVMRAIEAAGARGIQVALATGRMYHSALRFHQNIASQLPILAYNGAWIQCPLTGFLHQHQPVARELAEELLDYFEQPEFRDQLEVHCYIQDRLYVREITSQTESYVERSGAEPVAVGDLRRVLDSPTTKVLAIAEDPLLTSQILQELGQKYSRHQLYLTQSTPIYFEATNPQASKGLATRYLAEEILGLEADRVMAIGDNFNDVEMLQYAGLAVVMGNAPPEVRPWGDWLAPDVESDGVAAAIEKFLLA